MKVNTNHLEPKNTLVSGIDGSLTEYKTSHFKQILKDLSFGLDTKFIDIDAILYRTEMTFYQGISTIEIYNLMAETTAYMAISHPDYNILAGRILVKSLHQQTKESFSETIKSMFEEIDDLSINFSFLY